MNRAPLNIILADDDSDDYLFFKEVLEDLKVSANLIVVNNGDQLMETIANKTSQLPHLIFLDLNMPRKNGFECLAEIKSNKKLEQIPVIIISTSYNQKIVDKLYKTGARYYIRKPTKFSEFKKIINRAINLALQKNIVQPSKENFVLKVD